MERHELINEVLKLRAEVVRLEDVLCEAREALQFASDSPLGPINDTIPMMHRNETLFDFLDDAIAKARGRHVAMDKYLEGADLFSKDWKSVGHDKDTGFVWNICQSDKN